MLHEGKHAPISIPIQSDTFPLAHLIRPPPAMRSALQQPTRHSSLRLHRALRNSAAPFRESYGLFIDGQQVQSVDATSRLSVENPATTKHLAWVVSATPQDVSNAVTSSKKAFESGVWSRASTTDRALVLNAIAAALRARIPEFAEKESLQTGRPIREMRAQLTRLPGNESLRKDLNRGCCKL